MASTITLQEVVQWAQTFTKLIPIIGVGGYENEPALSICNNVIQEMLSEPYNWKFNSKNAIPFKTDSLNNTQDYVQNITDCGWLEACTRLDQDSTQQPQPIFQIDTVRNLPPSSEVGVPKRIAFINETDASLTFRLWPVPNKSKVWTIQPVYQKKPPLKSGLSDTWSPIPDELAYVYRQGFLAMAYKHADDPRYDAEYAKFLMMIQKALGFADAEADSDGFFPDGGLFIG